jgi:peptidoglycan/LPS O-acetylase OafA/YrhL
MGLNQFQSSILHIIRFICSQAVVVAHLISLFGWPMRTLISMASYAVLLFFILSGFLITTSLKQHTLSDPTYSFKQFFRDRFIRIYPPFLAALCLTFLLDITAFEITQQIYSLKQYFVNLAVNLFLLQEFPLAVFINEHYMIEFFRFRYLGTNVPLWTIGIEWWLYLFFGFAFFYVLRSSRIRIWQWFVLAFLALSPLYYVFVSVRVENGLTLYWFLGLFIAFARRDDIQPKNNAGSIVGIALLMAGLVLFPKIGYTNSALLFAFGLTLFLNGSKNSGSIYPTLHSISKSLAGYSYSLYLIHYPIIIFILNVFPSNFNGTYFFLIYLAVNIIAFGFAQLFEKSSPKLKQVYENYRSNRH